MSIISRAKGWFASKVERAAAFARETRDRAREGRPVTLYAFRGLENTSTSFPEELAASAARLGTDPNFLAAVMQIETAQTFDPASRNPQSGATGLIQFMPVTARSLATTTEELAQMSDVEQLTYVERFLRPYVGRLVSAGETYLAVFTPAGLGKADGHVLWSAGTKGYDQNKGLDRNKDGVITSGDVRGVAEGVYAAAKARGPFVRSGPSSSGAVDPYATREPQLTCDPTPKPGAVAFRDMLIAKFGGHAVGGGISRDCNQGGESEHKEGRALDWNPPDQATGDRAIAWLLAPEGSEPDALARRFGIQYLIWNRQMWRAYQPRGWSPYTGQNPHTDHVHFSFSWAGAKKQTSGYRGGALGGLGSFELGKVSGAVVVLLLLACAAAVASEARFT